MDEITIFWFRRDLRTFDNKGFYSALVNYSKVLPLFIFDKNILDDLSQKDDRRINFIYSQIKTLDNAFRKYSSGLLVKYGYPEDIFKELVEQYKIRAIILNHDYEPYAIERDKQIAGFAASRDIHFQSFKDQVIFEKDEIVKDNGTPYKVFTPYMRKWKSQFTLSHTEAYPSEKYLNKLAKTDVAPLPRLESFGFTEKDYTFPSPEPDISIIQNYDKLRDYPAREGTSRLSVHLRFGTISIRHIMQRAKDINESWRNELIWREFYMMILWHFPSIVNHSFKPKFDSIPWRNNTEEFEAWKAGKTGYPFVDAGMRELNNTGYMHNRLRMITASFLTKHLLIDWRWGEAYFAEQLLDYELASNNGGWQWAAGSGCDAAPYFRIFNPVIQIKKFDPGFQYVKKWVPEFDSTSYPAPVVEHKYARERALQVIKENTRNSPR